MYDFDTYKSYDMNGRIDTIGLDHMLEGLAEKNKQVIILFYLKVYSQREISDGLNIPLGTVKTRKRSGILKLRGFLERESSGRAAKAVDGNR
jgi:RNA polymerase sigma-70 factor (ECF subfamily)